MAIRPGKNYLGARIGTTTEGLPLYAVQDPCGPMEAEFVGVRVGTTGAGLPLFALAKCDAPKATLGESYAAVRVGSRGGRPVYSIACLACSCTGVSVRVTGCFSMFLPGARVEVYSLDGELVAEAITNASGLATFDLPPPGPGDYRVAVSAKRFVDKEQVMTLTCEPPLPPTPTVALAVAAGYRCSTCCGPYPQPTRWGIDLGDFGTLMVEDPEADCTWLGQTTVEVPGSTDLRQSMTEYADPASYNDCLGGGSEFTVQRRRVYCCETVPVGEFCASMATQMAYHYTASTGNSFGLFGGFVLAEDMGMITVNAPFRVLLGSTLLGGYSVRVGTKTLQTWILSEQYPDPGWCRHELYSPNIAWLDPTVPSYTLATGATLYGHPESIMLSDDCLATGTVERAVPAQDYNDFAILGGTAAEICYGDEFTLPVPPFTTWPWGMTSIRVFDPNVFPPPGPSMLRMASPEQEGSPAAKPPGTRSRRAEESLRLRELIHACPHLEPRQPGDQCGCLGSCSAGKGDLPGGRTSYRNCAACKAGDLASLLPEPG